VFLLLFFQVSSCLVSLIPGFLLFAFSFRFGDVRSPPERISAQPTVNWRLLVTGNSLTFSLWRDSSPNPPPPPPPQTTPKKTQHQPPPLTTKTPNQKTTPHKKPTPTNKTPPPPPPPHTPNTQTPPNTPLYFLLTLWPAPRWGQAALYGSRRLPEKLTNNLASSKCHVSLVWSRFFLIQTPCAVCKVMDKKIVNLVLGP